MAWGRNFRHGVLVVSNRHTVHCWTYDLGDVQVLQSWKPFMETPLRIRNVLFRAFIINLIVIVVTWLLSLSSAFTSLMQTFFSFDPHKSHVYMAGIIGIWKILNVVFFLVPAIAIHWEYRPKT
jgi:hypothetical protein